MVKHQKVSKYYENDCRLKAEVDKIDANKLKSVPGDLCKLGNVDNDVVIKNCVGYVGY